MARKKRNIYNAQTEGLKRRLQVSIALMVIIPGVFLLAFIFFGPSIGSLFSTVAKYNYQEESSDIEAPNSPIFKNPITNTNQSKIDLEGFAEPASNVKLFVNGPEKYETITTNDGQFKFVDIELNQGRNTIFAKAVDTNGNESDKSLSVVVILDTKGPDIEMIQPNDGDEVKNLNERVLIQGKLSEKSSVTINDRRAIVKPDDTFELLLGVKEGPVEIKIIATDEAGNTKEEELTINYKKESE